MKKVGKFKKGAASFYIVAMSTLILVIIAASFAAVIISEITRTSNDDLAQSAYDSALAGVEDAKLAYYNYQNCKAGATYSGSALSCSDLINWVEKGVTPRGTNECDVVANSLGRNISGEGEDKLGVLVQEGEVDNNMQQYYTCVTMTNQTKDYQGYISESNPTRTVRVQFADDVPNSAIKTVRVKWHSGEDGEAFNYEEITKDGIFGDKAVMPAVISVGMVQTSKIFKLSDFDMTKDSKTNRGMVYLVPKNPVVQSEAEGGKYKVASGNEISSYDGFLKSNDKKSQNLPFLVECDTDRDFACQVEIDIPDPVGDSVIANGDNGRSQDTFIFAINLPYGGPSTHFSLEFLCGDDGDDCKQEVSIDPKTGDSSSYGNQATLDGVQVSIDSTGRANDLYRRMEVRMDPGDVAYPYPLYAIQVLGNNGGNSLVEKDLSPTSEHDFKP